MVHQEIPEAFEDPQVETRPDLESKPSLRVSRFTLGVWSLRIRQAKPDSVLHVVGRKYVHDVNDLCAGEILVMCQKALIPHTLFPPPSHADKSPLVPLLRWRIQDSRATFSGVSSIGSGIVNLTGRSRGFLRRGIVSPSLFYNH